MALDGSPQFWKLWTRAYLLIFGIFFPLVVTQVSYDFAIANKGQPEIDALFDSFKEVSGQAMRNFKRELTRSYEFQTQILDLENGNDEERTELNDRLIFRIYFPGHFIDRFDNSKLINYPMPNLPGSSRITQLLISLDYANHLSVWQFHNHTTVLPLGESFALDVNANQYKATKMLSFVQDRPRAHNLQRAEATFRLFVIILFKNIENSPRFATFTDKLAIYLFDGFWHDGFGLVKELKHFTHWTPDGKVHHQQAFEKEEILDFDLLKHRPHLRSNKNVFFLSSITKSALANAKFELNMHRFDPRQERYEFNLMATFDSDEVLNGNIVKIVNFHSSIYLICAHSRQSEQPAQQETAVTLYHYNQVEETRGHIAFVTKLANDSLIGQVRDIRYWPTEDFPNFLFITANSVEVFKFYEYSKTIEWMDSKISPNLKAFGFAKIPSFLHVPPMMVSTDGRRFTTYRKIGSDLFDRKLENDPFPLDYAISRIEVFNWANRYYIWTIYSKQFAGPNSGSGPRSFGRIYVAELEDPQNSNDIRTLQHCLIDLQHKIEDGIVVSKEMNSTREQLLVINNTKPILLVNVTAETIRLSNVPKAIIMDFPDARRIVDAQRVKENLASVRHRLEQLNETMRQTVVMRSGKQTIYSPVLFQKPLQVDHLKIVSATDNFHLNLVPFEVFANNTLSLEGDQVLNYGSGGRVNFKTGLKVDHLDAHQINDVHVKKALFVNQILGTQMVTGEHTFRTHVELRNGTTAPSINSVKLYDLFQDVHHPVQLLRYPTRFQELSVPELTIDTTLNGVNLKQWQSEIIWLENVAMNQQEISGNGLQFVGGIKAIRLHVDGTINQKFDLDHFMSTAARTNRELTISGPITFHHFAYAHDDVNFSGLLNGAIDLWKDTLLLHANQDFSHLHQSNFLFDSTVSFKNLSMSLLNGRVHSQDFVLRSDLIADELRQTMVNYSPLFPKLWNKFFKNDILVKNNVDLNDGTLINGVDVSKLFQKLDTVASFNAPLKVEQIDVGGDMYTVAFNHYSAAHVNKIIGTRLLKTKSQIIQVPITFLNGAIKANNLMFNHTSSGLAFPYDFISGNSSTPEVIIQGSKYFSSSVFAKDIHLGPPAGLVNGHKISTLYSAMVKNDTTGSGAEQIGGRKSFNQMLLLGNLLVEDGLLNECFIDKAVQLTGNQQILPKLTFDRVKIDMKQFDVANLMINRQLSGVDFKALFADLVLYQPNHPIHFLNKHFPQGLRLNELTLNATARSSTIGSVNLANILKHAITLNDDQVILSSLNFQDAIFKQIDSFSSIQNYNQSYFESVILKDTNPIHIYGEKSFHRDIHIQKLHVIGETINRHFNLTHITRNSLMTYGDQIITEKHVFLKPIQFHNLQINPRVRVSDRYFSDFVQLDKDISFTNDIIFEHLIEAQNLYVSGFIDQCNVTYVAQNAIKRNPDHTFNLKAHLITPHLTVRKNLYLKHLLNDQPNFIPNITYRDDQRPLKVDLTFKTDLVATQLFVEAFINAKYNMTHILKDAVFVHVPQVITGRKVFSKPLKIYGFVRQNPEKQVFIDGLMNLVNVTHLFTTTVMADRPQEIGGKKHFFGRISFAGPLTLRKGLNGAPVPEGFHLTHSNERISGQTYFTKRVFVHENLNARLINNINLTQFVSNLVFVQPIETVPQSSKQMETISVVTFEDGIYIKNLTIHRRINDIPVDELLHRDSYGVQINGLKEFQKPIQVFGNVQVGTVNSVDFEKDLKGEWIDMRANASAIVPVNVTGNLIIRRATEMDSLEIMDNLNSFKMDQFDPKHFATLNQKVFELNTTLGKGIRDLSSLQRNMQEHVQVDYLIRLKYFNMIQNFPHPIDEFVPLPYLRQGDSAAHIRTDNLFIIQSETSFNSSHTCESYLTRYFELFSLNRLPDIVSLPNAAFLLRSIAHHHLPPYSNLKTTIARSVSDEFSTSAVIHSFNQERTCFEKFFRPGAHSNNKFGHMVTLFNGKYWPDSKYASFPIFPKSHGIVKQAKMFSTGQVKYLVLLFDGDFSPESSSLAVYQLEKQPIIVQEFTTPITDFDLIDTTHSGGSILLSVVYPSLSLQQMYQAEPSRSYLFTWNSSFFNPLRTEIQYSNGYSRTKFVKTTHLGTFLLFSTVRNKKDENVCLSSSYFSDQLESFENFIDVWRLNSNGFFRHFQRLNLGSSNDELASGMMESVEIGQQMYLFALSGVDTVSAFQWQGFNRFVPMNQFRVEGVTSVALFWNERTLYMALGSRLPFKSQLLYAVLSARGEERQLLLSSNWLKTIEEMANYNRRLSSY